MLPPKLSIGLENALAGFVQKLFGLTGGWQKQHDIAKNNLELGIRYFKLGHPKDAVFRCKIVTWLEPANADAWYYLGRGYLSDGKRAQAVAALKKARQLRPEHDETKYMLAVAMGKSAAADLPRTMPMSLALEYFETGATEFNAEQQHYGYRPELLVQAIRATLTPGRLNHDILELGVGTGLCGAGLRDVAQQITGVDMADNMIAQAMKLKDTSGKKIYDALIKRELHDYLKSAPVAAFDVVLAGNVVSYIGDLERLFKEVARVLKSGGIFALTADSLREGEDFKFDPAVGRFRFSKTYVNKQAHNNHLSEVTLEEAQIYADSKMWLCVFRK